MNDKLNRVKDTITKDLLKGQQTIFNGLVANVPVNRLPEPLFASYFLPGFIGTNPNQNWMLEWISIAGSASSEVSVFDPSTQQELFRVPPVLASRNILLPKTEGDLGDIFKRHEMMGNALGSSGTNYLFNALEEKSVQAINTYENTTDERWRAILARYGYAPQVASNSNVSASDDMFDY